MVRHRGRRVGKKARRGAALVELTVCMPILITLLLGVWDIGKLLQQQQIVANAVREAGRQASTGQLTRSQTEAVARQYLVESGLRITDPVTGTPNVTTASANLTSGNDFTNSAQQDELMVRLEYPYKNNRWNVLQFFFSSELRQRVEYTWRNMADKPITVDTSIPLRPKTWN